MKKSFKKIDASALAPLLVFALFAICILIVLLSGANIYRAFTERDQIGYDHRTISQYLTTRVRQSDIDASLYVGAFSDQSAQAEGDTLFIMEQSGDEEYVTRIYCHDGYLYELFTLSGISFDPQDGESILPLNHLHFRIQDNLLYIEIEYANAETDTLILHLRSRQEVLP